ncbi:subunit N of NADH:ubiquinone oxidoreductase [Paenibacillus sp. 32O-W]|uniref:NADH-quinone oxidoreductase subunit N n=1 Tax=Paenibacillus sp. 32O-W TaxID=1695218 RepID=UPI00071F9698|nr:NADH-quinone oxidoreductase subunit N [Paenibacillus sp. 32O-W]ALS26051.1 subunit N of NADH:ubiquinone oxidoreductase [Paenibacillus sp. 32O-W]
MTGWQWSAPITWADMGYLAPEATLAAFMLALVLLDLLMPRKYNRSLIGWIALGGVLVSMGLVIWRMLEMNPVWSASEDAVRAGAAVSLLGDSYRIDDFASLMKTVFLAATGLILLMSVGTVKERDVPTRGEFYYLLLPATIGAMTMASAGDLITLYIGLELLSITTYVLVGLRKRSSKSFEAAFKYIVTGGISSAFILFGMSYLYGLTGSTGLNEIGMALPQLVTDYQALVYAAFFFMIAGFGIKIAAAPFHAWAPDVYQGAPTPVTAYLAVVSKTAALAIVMRVFYNTVYFAESGAAPVNKDVFTALLAVAATAMIVGSAAALRQRNAKRLLALSGVANAGYLLVPIGLSLSGAHSNNFGEFFFYAAAYLFMNIGMFAVLSAVSDSTGNTEISRFAGLYHRAPWTAAASVVLLLSLAGLPVTGGFFGKLFILMGAAAERQYWLAAIMAVTSIVTYYFYFGIIRQMFMRTASDEPLRMPATVSLTLWICAVATVLLGLFPNPVMQWIDRIFSLPGDLIIR